MTRPSSGETRVIVRGLAVIFVVASLFAAWKIAFWQSQVVHTEVSSIHRLFPGGILVRFPQEPVNAVDILTGGFLALAGATALAISFGMGERLRRGRVVRSGDARSVRAFFALAGIGLIWLGFDEVFLAHEFLSANLDIGDSWILLGYAAVGGLAVLAWQRVLRSSTAALVVMGVGALFHASALGLDFLQDSIGWAPEEPLEMLGAAFYALAMATYATRLVLADALSERAPATERVATERVATPIYELPASAIEPLVAPATPGVVPSMHQVMPAPPAASPAAQPWPAPTPSAHAWPSDPAWTH